MALISQGSGKTLNIWTDGAARGNPGPAGIGFVIKDARLSTIKEYSEYIGVATNNVAEYKALIICLGYIRTQKPVAMINIFMDSELVVKQIRGEYKVKNQGLIPLYRETMQLLSGLDYKISNIGRSKNREADKLANEAIDDYFAKYGNKNEGDDRPVQERLF